MTVQISFDRFKINKLSYEAQPNKQNTTNATLDISNIRLNISIDKKIAEINVQGTITSSERILNLHVSYYYLLHNLTEKKSSLTQANKYLEKYGINTSVVMFEDLIKQITSLDYMNPIILSGYKIPGSVKRINN